MSIDVEEAARHVDGPAHRSSLGRPGWFVQIDKNEDGMIQPAEFDADLDEAVVAEFAGMK